jgi:hypothetical protein
MVIKEFNLSKNPWKIDWLGHIEYPANGVDDPKIAVYLSELKDDYTKPLSNNSISNNPNPHRTVMIKVGLIHLLKEGSVWKDGERVDRSITPFEIEVSLQHSDLRLAQYDYKHPMFHSDEILLNKKRYKLGPDAFQGVSRSWIAVYENYNHPTIKTIIFPCSTFFKFFFASSPKAINKLFFGQLGKIIDLQTSYYDEQEKSVFLMLHKNFKKDEAEILANIIADPVAEKEYKRFRSNLMKNHLEFKSGEALRNNTFMKMSLPISVPVQLKLHGKLMHVGQFNSGNLWALLVTEIRDIKVKAVFERIIYDSKNNNKKGENSDDPDLIEMSYGSFKEQPKKQVEKITATSNDSPNENIEKSIFSIENKFHVTNLEIVDNPKIVQQYKNKKGIQSEIEIEHSGESSTGMGSPSESRGANFLDQSSYPPPSLFGSFDLISDVVAYIRQEGGTVNCLTTSKEYTLYKNITLNQLPRKIKNVYTWHLSSENIGHTRSYVVLEFFTNGIWHYAIEMEPKDGYALSILRIRHANGEKLKSDFFQRFMIDVTRNHGWRVQIYYKYLLFSTRKHPSKEKQNPHIALANNLKQQIYSQKSS